MNIYEESKLISLTSQSASTYFNSSYLSNVLFETPGFIINKPSLIKIELSLVHAEIPVSFYVINYTNNQFKYKLGTGAITTVSIPVGNYNANTLITAIKTIVNNVNFSVTINKITGVLTFSYNSSFIIYTDNTYSISKILGFYSLASGFNSVTNAITAPYPLNLLGIKKINICSSKLTTNNYVSGSGSTSLISCISVDQPAFGLIIYQTQGNKYSLGNKEISKIDIQIFDENFNLINFNNIDWSLLFNVTATYDLNIDVNAPLIPIATAVPMEKNTIEKIQETPETPEKPEIPNPELEQLEFLSNN